MIWFVLGAVLPSAAVTCTAAFLVRRFGPQLGLVDHPGHRKVHARVVPTSGGLAIWLGIVLPAAAGQLVLAWLLFGDSPTAAGAWLPDFVRPHLSGLWMRSSKLWVLLAGATALAFLGLADDRFKLDWKLRILIETIVASVTVALGWRLSLYIDSPLVTWPLSVLWIVGLVNSFNMLDNMDGLSAGVAAIAAAMLAAVLLLAPDPVTNQPQLFVAGFLLMLVGALLGFLWHNRPPARLFMGDTGSYLIGYLIATTTITATFAGGSMPPYSIFAPLCVLAVPLYDTLTVVAIRLRARQSPFVGDTNHFSHRLVRLGMTRPQAVLTICLTTATCGLGALLLHQVDLTGAAVILLLITCVLVLVGILETAGRRARPSSNGSSADGPTPSPPQS